MSQGRHPFAQLRYPIRALSAEVSCGTQVGEPVTRADDDIPGRLDAIEYLLQQIAKKLETLDSLSDRVDEISEALDSVAGFVAEERRRVGS